MQSNSGPVWFTLEHDAVKMIFFNEPAGCIETDGVLHLAEEVVQTGVYSKAAAHRALNSTWEPVALGSAHPELDWDSSHQKCRFVLDNVAYFIFRACDDDDDDSDEVPLPPVAPEGDSSDLALIFGQGLNSMTEGNARELAKKWSRAVSNHLFYFDGLRTLDLEEVDPAELNKVFETLSYSGDLFHHPKLEAKAHKMRDQMDAFASVKARISDIESDLRNHRGFALFHGTRPETVRGANPLSHTGILDLQKKYFTKFPPEKTTGFFFEKIPTSSNLKGWNGVIPITNIRWATLGVSCANARPIREVNVMPLLSSFYGAPMPLGIKGIPTYAKIKALHPLFDSRNTITLGRWQISSLDDREIDITVKGDAHEDFELCLGAIMERFQDSEAVIGVGDLIQSYRVNMKHIEHATMNGRFYAVTKGAGRNWAPAITKCESARYYSDGSEAVRNWLLKGSFQRNCYRVHPLPGVQEREQSGLRNDSVNDWMSSAQSMASAF